MTARIRKTWPLFFLVGLSGCIPYIFPSLVMTPPVKVSSAGDPVHVFRVDVCKKWGPPCYHDEWYALRRVPLIAGVAPPQMQTGLDRGICIIGVALNYHFHYHDGVHVRLYRPGYELVEFKEWQLGKKVAWQPVEDLAGREAAIDQLLGNCGTRRRWLESEQDGEWRIPDGLRPGCYSSMHRQVLLFAAREYEKLAGSTDPQPTWTMHRRLMKKSEAVQNYAGQ